MNITKENILAQVNNVVRGDNAQAYIEAAFDLLADTVVSTLGPNGRSVIFGGQTPSMTKDGVSVSNQIVVRDPLLDSTMRLIKDGSRYSDTSVGDGTTTTMMMARAFYQLGKKLMEEEGLSPYAVKSALDSLNKETIKHLKSLTTPLIVDSKVDEELLIKVITTSVNGDSEMANLIKDALLAVNDYKQLAMDNVISVKKGNRTKDELIIEEGMHYSCGYQSAMAVNSTEGRVEYKEPTVMIYRDEIGDDTATIMEVLKHLTVMANMQRPIVLFAEKFSDRAMNVLHSHNDLKAQGCQLCLIRLPDHGDQQTRIIDDLTPVLKLQPLLSKDYSGLEDSIVKWFSGTIQQIVVTRNTTTLLPNKDIYTPEFDQHIESLKSSIELCRDDYDKGKMLERLQSLNGKMITLLVGGVTETERRERKDRFDDGVGAGCAAVLGGVVVGGGRTLNYIATNKLTTGFSNQIGSAYRSTLNTPIQQLCRNSGIMDKSAIDLIVAGMSENNNINESYDVITEQLNVNLFDKGILDASKVTESALVAGLSVAMSLLTTNGIMVLPQDIK